MLLLFVIVGDSGRTEADLFIQIGNKSKDWCTKSQRYQYFVNSERAIDQQQPLVQ